MQLIEEFHSLSIQSSISQLPNGAPFENFSTCCETGIFHHGASGKCLLNHAKKVHRYYCAASDFDNGRAEASPLMIEGFLARGWIVFQKRKTFSQDLTMFHEASTPQSCYANTLAG